MTSSQEKLLQKLHESKLKYIQSVPARVSEIKLIWNQLNTNEWSLDVMLKMQNLAHNLAGSGGTFGFPELSKQAKLLEMELNELKVLGNTPPSSATKVKIDTLITLLQQVELKTIPDRSSLSMSSLNKTKDIYILDSNLESSFNIARQLMYYGCTVTIINSTDRIEEDLRHATPLLILIDADFAEIKLNSHNVIHTLRKDWLLTCPLIYISKSDDFEHRVAAMKATASAYFTKPIDIALLIERINIVTNAGIVEPYRILLVEDDMDLANFYAAILEKGGMQVFIETQPELALSKILKINPELVIMDLYMPNYNGIDLIKVIRQHQALYTLPIVLLTAEQDVDLQFLAREVGVDDFLHKPITEQHLFDAVLNRVQRTRYTNLSMTKDSLTGLFVHKKITECLELHVNICKQAQGQITYVILDLDNFKKVNDTYGHLAGDNVLVSLANLLKAELRDTDFVGRYGGEEFVVIFPDTDEKTAFDTLERLRKKFAAIDHYSTDKTFKVTFSAGIANFPKYKDVATIMAMADKALYKSKENGRDQITIA